MTQHNPHVSHQDRKPSDRQTRTQLRADADQMLREIAFVLKMTQRVRDEMAAEHETREPALV